MKEDRDHWAGLQDLVKGVDLVGGPSWNLKLLRRGGELLGKTGTMNDGVWLALVYGAVYSVHSTLAVVDRWSWRTAGETPVELIEDWLVRHWDGLTVRKERLRTHGDPRRLAASLHESARWVDRNAMHLELGDDYDRLWAQVQTVPRIGRYFGIKTCGALRELGVTEAEQYDIRANGARQGRKTLAALWGVEPDNRRVNDVGYESAARLVRDELEAEGLPLSFLDLESLLCEYQQMLNGSLYPGKSTDTDLDAWRRLSKHLTTDHPLTWSTGQARSELLPEGAVLTGRRKELQTVYRDLGYVWMDSVYDYFVDGFDPSTPYVRSEPWTDWEPRTRPESYTASASRTASSVT